MKYRLRQLALGAAVPCRAELRCPKRTSVTQDVRYFLAEALRSRKNSLIAGFTWKRKDGFSLGVAVLLFAAALIL